MAKQNWNKIGAGFACATLLFAIFAFVDSFPISSDFDEAQKYFLYTIILMLGLFIYFQYFKK